VFRRVQAPRGGEREQAAAYDVSRRLTTGISGLDPLLGGGIIELWYDAPQEMEIDRHFAHLEHLIETVKPQRAVIDSLSTYGTSLGPVGRGFRDFLHGCVALMKEHQVAAVYNHENPEMLGMASMMGDFAMSSLVDNIVLMNWVELGDAFRLGMTIAKMRANRVDRTTHEVEILDGQGMRVLPRELRVPTDQHPFSSYAGLVSRAPERRDLQRRAETKDQGRDKARR
jgi:KaiC/GvpD/RAD55 family RecA-like ATPase